MVPVEVVAYFNATLSGLVKYISDVWVDPNNELLGRLKYFIRVDPESRLVNVDCTKARTC